MFLQLKHRFPGPWGDVLHPGVGALYLGCGGSPSWGVFLHPGGFSSQGVLLWGFSSQGVSIQGGFYTRGVFSSQRVFSSQGGLHPGGGFYTQGGLDCRGALHLGGFSIPGGMSCDLSHHAFHVTCMLPPHQLSGSTCAAPYIV